ncbi:TetR family transcriptional regulator [Conyzicola nivalis]|uniref:TetR family transcriptional regulator n=1 Tax=Conyzicola nivalis TaxID=1477021 RepID=A0A916SUW4_9MICO|nr:TetR family transcriptional regulator [Conyzicola nivalis]GGB15113.1 TetR family transcriptional regulator [Conyzicola nivalis]
MTAHTDDAAPAARRPRGRPRKSTPAVDTRGLIVRAAGTEFAAHGYDATSVRAVARRAGVDAALVHHYFDTKADLFAATVRVPVRPDRLVAEVLAGPRDAIGTSIVLAAVTALDDPKAGRRVIRLLHTALGQEFAATMLRQFLHHEVFGRIADELGGEQPELRASLAGSQMVGLIVARYGLRVEPLASASAEEVARRVGPIIQWHLTGDLPPLDTAQRTGE